MIEIIYHCQDTY